MILRPPEPALFPYTTLFRSCCARAGQGRHWCRMDRIERREPADHLAQVDPLEGRLALHIVAPVAFQVDAHMVDRKSTRLNSSHPSISYAVFCLKKKT